MDKWQTAIPLLVLCCDLSQSSIDLIKSYGKKHKELETDLQDPKKN